MVVRVLDPILVKIDADTEGARRELVKFEREAERSAGKIERSFLRISAAAGQGSAQGGAGGRSLAGASRRSDPGERIRVDTSRPTGEKRDASILSIVGGAIALGGGTVGSASPHPVGKAIGGAAVALGTGLALTAEMIEQLDKLEIKTFTLNEAVATYKGNLEKVTELGKEFKAGRLEDDGLGVNFAKILNDQEVALAENQAIVTGIAVTWEGLAGSLSRVQRFGGKFADPSAAQNIIDDIKAVQDALIEISKSFKDPGTQRLLSRLQDFLARTSPSAPSIDEGGVRPDGLGRPRPNERIRSDPEESSFLDRGGASPRRVQLASGGTSEAGGFGGAGLGLDGGAESLTGFAERLAELPGAFVETREQAGSFAAEIAALGQRLTQSNALLGEQSGLLGQLSAQAPALGGELAALFEAGSEAGRVFAEVTDAVGASLLDAFEGAIARGESLSDVLKGLAIDMAEIVLKSAGNALLESILGGLFGGLAGASGGRAATAGTSIPGGIGGFAKGGAFAGDSVMARNIKAFARGGIVDTPEAFAFANGLGIMGEAGPEAILPLARARSGELGVRAMLGRQPAAGGSAPAAAGMTVFIDARGADREGLARVERKVQELHGNLIRVNQSIEPRALRAWANHRRRGGFR